MPNKAAYKVTLETDEDGQFFKLPHGWLIEPENSDVIVIYEDDGTYVVRPVIGEDGQPNCKFIIPSTDAG